MIKKNLDIQSSYIIKIPPVLDDINQHNHSGAVTQYKQIAIAN